ncbi:phytanoyl-CoA dioxygenase [Streptomyces griseocarneus]|nr:phytanoyl-CoA dioxygenase [Streptomyces griseocarneus]
MHHAEDTRPGPLGESGFATGLRWAETADAQALAGSLTAQLEGREVVKNPHATMAWARQAVRSPALVEEVAGLLGGSVAVENTFLILKPPSSAFTVPWHQDGINERLQLDPGLAVTAWLSISGADADNGAVAVLPGSHTAGWRPFTADAATGPEGSGRGRPLVIAEPSDADQACVVAVPAGEALLMDVRLLHRSGPNTTARHRIALNIRYVAPGGVRPRGGHPMPQLDRVCGPGW